MPELLHFQWNIEVVALIEYSTGVGGGVTGKKGNIWSIMPMKDTSYAPEEWFVGRFYVAFGQVKSLEITPNGIWLILQLFIFYGKIRFVLSI